MQVSKILVALTIAAGFTSASFAQGTANPATPATPTAKVVAPAPVASEKKVDVLKAAEPAKAEAAAKSEAPKTNAVKPAEKHAKAKGHEQKGEMNEAAAAKTEVKAQAKPAATPAPVTK